MSAETLRRAAALMRERAEAALLATGDGSWVFAGVGYNSINGTVYRVESETRVGVGDQNTEEQAEHIASWHPFVALAVADWLDRSAHLYVCNPYDDRFPGSETAHAITVARAYLGES